MRSHLLEGKVRHRRAHPVTYELEHDVFYFALDLGELDEVVARLRLVTRNGRGVVELRDADHLVEPATDVATDVDRLLRDEGEDPTGWRITMVTNLRVLGYVFNPASFFLCRDGAGTLRLVIVEVHNTFGERHCYVLRPGPGQMGDRAPGEAAPRVDATRADAPSEGMPAEMPFTAAMDKDFFVSPFIGMDGRYAVHVRDDPDGLRIAISLRETGRQLLATSLVLRRRPLTDGTLLRMLLRHPLLPQRTIALIHWHALRLWRKGVPFLRHGEMTGHGTGGRQAAASEASR